MYSEVVSNKSTNFSIEDSTLSLLRTQKQQLHSSKRSKFTIDPRLSILPSSIDPKKSKLQIYKQHLLNIQLRKQSIPRVPQPAIISCFNLMKQQKSMGIKKQKLKKELQSKKQQYQKLKKNIEKYMELYDSKQQSMKQKILLSKILSTKLQSQFEKTKQRFKDLQFSKIMNTAQKKLYFYQLAQIFFNDKTRNIFSFQKQLSRTDQQMGICLGYLGFLIQKVAKIAGVDMWLKFKFKGSRSTITIYDPKVVESFSNTSLQGTLNLMILEQTYVLHPKQARLNQALNYLFEQLKQLMKYNLGIISSSMGKSNNLYELCQQLSKYLLNG